MSMPALSSPLTWFFLLTVGIGLCAFIYFLFTTREKSRTAPVRREKGKAGAPGVCPLCCITLLKNEQIKTKVFPSESDNQLCSIYGCPHCYPVPEHGVIRYCPVCKSSVENGAYLIARLFDRGKNGKHVRILGCKHCRNC